VSLVWLNLISTKVVGQAGALVPLVNLTTLSLEGTAVVGCGTFCAADGPFRTHCGLHPDPTWGCHRVCP
jgi:hypothetical protein